MSLGLTKRHKQALDYIRQFIADQGYPPSYQQIMEALGLHSKSGIHRIVHALASRGHITMQGNRARTIAIGPNYRSLLWTLAEHVRRVDYAAADQLAEKVLTHFQGEGAL